MLFRSALVALGVGTALVYPTLLATVADIAPPSQRGAMVGIYRLWRDLGYAIGALLAGALADAIGMSGAINVIGAATIASGIIVAVRLKESASAAQRFARDVQAISFSRGR